MGLAFGPQKHSRREHTDSARFLSTCGRTGYTVSKVNRAGRAHTGPAATAWAGDRLQSSCAASAGMEPAEFLQTVQRKRCGASILLYIA